MSGSSTAILAMKLSHTSDYLCPTGSTVSSKVSCRRILNLERVKQIVEQNPTDDVVKVELCDVFCSAESLPLCFLQSPLQSLKEQIFHGVDISHVREFYKIVASLSPDVRSYFDKERKRLLASLDLMNHHDEISIMRIFIFFLEDTLPATRDTKEIMKLLYSKLGNVTEGQKKILIQNYFSKLDKLQFTFVLKKLQDFLCLTILSSTLNKDGIKKDAGILGAIKTISWLWEISRKTYRLPLDMFYNTPLNDYISFPREFQEWGQPYNSRNFCFCQYPFILNPESKTQLLAMESMFEQRERQNEALQMKMHGYLEVPYLIMKVRRLHLILDSLNDIVAMKYHDPRNLKKPLRISFEGEEAIDAGGVQKEWFQLLVAEIFSSDYGMFVTKKEMQVHFFDHRSNDLAEFELLGTVLGLAIYNSVILDIHFPLFVYKKLCGHPVGLEDLTELDPVLVEGLKRILEYNESDFEEVFGLVFEINYEYYGTVRTHNLIPNGNQISVNLENKQQYVDTYVNYLLNSSVESQFEAFKAGFQSLCDGPTIKLFEPEELQLLICGSPILDFYDLERGTNYDNGYDRNHETVINFWSVVHTYSEENKKKLLFFITGSDRTPIGGLSKLQLVISRQSGDSDRLPTSHTCFNHLILPEYPTQEKLSKFLGLAITNSTGFGMR
eukprot:TRINITY_DN1452_c0_g3_i6.p1 TRINITY_DN1452_c0_g3~~TRINITY_DN1452_c0_g3_i6.p1  ORF type:complete len:668 (-),score=120.19 TRINITY_DN1452_c0_g3_i6:96-2099(-)